MISLCMIVKNEDKYLGKCLKSVANFVDEIIIVDTGSSDNTKEIASKFTDKIFNFEWCNDFSKARNYSIEKASNDWILVLDGDEICSEFNENTVKFFTANYENIIGRLKIINYFGSNLERKKSSIRLGRLFNKNYYEYKGTIHEQLVSKRRNKLTMQNIDISLEHFGYLEENIITKSKIKRNEELLIKELERNPRDSYILYQIGKIYFLDKRFYKAIYHFRKSLEFIQDINLEYAEDLIVSYGYSLLNTKKYSAALDLRKYENSFYNSTDFKFLLGLIHMNNGSFYDSIKYFKRCLEDHKESIEGINSFLALYNLGVIYECIGEKNKAINYYKRCNNYMPAIKRLNELTEELNNTQ